MVISHNIYLNFSIALRSEKLLSKLVLIELHIENYLIPKMYPSIRDKLSCFSYSSIKVSKMC